MTLSNTDRVRIELEHRIASGDLPPGSAIDESLLCTFSGYHARRYAKPCCSWQPPDKCALPPSRYFCHPAHD